MYRATRQWQPNRYISLFAKQGILYFLAIFLFALLNVLGALGKLPTGGWQAIVLFIVELVPMYTLIPRFILSMRELYARGVQVGNEGGIDSGFGLSVSGRAGAAMVFADVEQNEDDVEEPGIPMEDRTSQPE
ncbi:hypothetical protein L210DRAFT_3536164 [Boletus edulis BED1]|uniref:Uncharacterized protein n=1 Tax=Boletus edulis BED1 TaxID=1328754 RepID=A0AAD4GH60_BOLED|nr:hypothetical protein L210DRAFT_3536164 [Boletus edulis BED1]